METGNLETLPTETLVDTILKSHRALARVHEDEVQEIQTRLREVEAAAKTIQGFGADIQQTLQAVGKVTEEQQKLVNAWNGRHQDFLENFDKQTVAFMKQANDKSAGVLETQMKNLTNEAVKKLKSVFGELVASLDMDVNTLRKKVEEHSHNVIHDLDALDSAVRRHTKNWQDQTLKLYVRILLFSVFGAFTGTLVALFLSRFVH